jgi:hypothetical protein
MLLSDSTICASADMAVVRRVINECQFDAARTTYVPGDQFAIGREFGLRYCAHLFERTENLVDARIVSGLRLRESERRN